MERTRQLRLAEALVFASAEPVAESALQAHLGADAPIEEILGELAETYARRGVNLVRIGGRWAFRTAPDLAPHFRLQATVARKLSRAAVETLAIVAYHQPVTRADIEEIRGVALSKGTLDTLLEAGWIRPRGRRRTPGRPVLWVTTDGFLDHFGLAALDDLPGIEELKASGLLERRPSAGPLAIADTAPENGAGEAEESHEGLDEAAAAELAALDAPLEEEEPGA